MPARQSAALLSWYFALFSVAIEFTISGNLLTSLGTSYIGDGGYLLEKIHPGSYAATISFVLKMASARPNFPEYWRKTLPRNWCVYAFMTGVAYCCLYLLFSSGPGTLVVMLDTFVPAGMLALVLADMTSRQAHIIQTLVRSLLMLNATIALVEALTQSHVVPIPRQGNDFAKEFRPTALYDHALTGATVAMLGLWLPFSFKASSLKNGLYLGLVLSSLIAFGERAPLCIVFIVGIIFFMSRLGGKVLIRKFQSVDIVYVSAASVLLALAYITVRNCAVGTRLVAHLYWDDSAQVRLSQFGILTSLNLQELLFGCARDNLLALIEPLRLSTRVAVIENFWLSMLVSLGLLTFPVFAVSFLSLLCWLWRVGGTRGRVMILTFICVASSSNSLGRKSTLLIPLVASVLCTSAKSMGYLSSCNGSRDL